MSASPSTMEPLSARIPSDLYLWLARLEVDGATTNSDKLRVLLGQLKRQHDGAVDYAAAHAWLGDLTCPLRSAMVRIAGESGQTSELLGVLVEHLVSGLALVVSQVPLQQSDAARLEEALVRRVFAMCDSLLRQAVTAHAAAYDPAVVRRFMGPTIELADRLQTEGASRNV